MLTNLVAIGLRPVRRSFDDGPQGRGYSGYNFI
jgi:hypothetical protein